MRTKIVNGIFHFKRKIFYWNEAIKPLEKVAGKLRIVEDNRNTYVIITVGSTNNYQGIMMPIIEDYDSLEEIK